MNMRTDVEFRGGKLSARQDPSATADSRLPLPEVSTPDVLRPGWGESLRNAADDPTIRAAADAHDALAQSWRGLEQMRAKQPPESTQAMHLQNLAKMADQAVERHARALDRNRANIRDRKKQIETELRESLGFSSRDAAELRQVMRGMSDVERSKFINEAAKRGDGAVLAAVMDAHPSLSGLDEKRQAAVWRQAMKEHAPKALQTVDALDRADQTLFGGYTAALDGMDAMTAKAVRDKHQAAAEEASKARRAAEQVGWDDHPPI